ncbi:uncharacterized protein LY89DRAFT_731242 [Mollisia scopiformis]|uniref:F-box domain-containing protein n=1 Tax=Mollisia scopiformis TaxID=149040 RepID=A0A194XIQ8_MOLSC|nr:uncharacterized protein LY89DRAFT_731242 [Mollisia scopiformis]KUJ20004.1 hypothetical protein LY89DRAFT_731242 [Mollisia scopiformis]
MANKLANELWIAIIRLVPRSDLPEVSRVSKRLHALTESILYSEIDTTKHKDGPDAALALLYRTIVSRPDLALHVKHVTLSVMTKVGATQSVRESGTLDTSSLAPNYEELLQGYLAESMLSQDVLEDWHATILSERNWDAVAAFILLMVSENVESLTMDNYGAMSRHYFINILLSHAQHAHALTESRRPFSQLQEVALNRGASIVNFMRFRSIRPYLTLGSVAKFTGHDIADANTMFDAGSDSWTTESIALINCTVNAPTLKNFLCGFQALKSFEWVNGKFIPNAEFYNAIQGVPKFKSHLEKLIISNPHQGNIWNASVPAFDLTDFAALKTFVVPSLTALGPLTRENAASNNDNTDMGDVEDMLDMDDAIEPPGFFYSASRINDFTAALPPALESLKITACSSSMYDCALRIVSTKCKTLSNLKQLTLVFTDERTGTARNSRKKRYAPSKGRLAEYKMIAKKNGVELKFLESVEQA